MYDNRNDNFENTSENVYSDDQRPSQSSAELKNSGYGDYKSVYGVSKNDGQQYTYSYTPYSSRIDSNGVINNGGASQPPAPKKNGRYGIGAIILCILLSAVISASVSLSIAFSSFDTASSDGSNSENSSVLSDASNNSSNNQLGSNSTIFIEGNVESLVEAVYDKAANSVVGIRTIASVESFFGSGESTGEGSGVIYTEDGYIITNYHVIESAVKSGAKASTIEVYMISDPETPIDARIVGYNASTDLAVVKIDKTGLPTIEIGDSDNIKVGSYAVAIGCPGGIEFLGSVSYGIISGLNRSITIDSIGTMDLIQTDAAINPGNSGGALLNSNGQLIGINSSKLVDESFEGMGFAIPVNTMVKVINEILENKDNPSPYIGIEIYKYDSKYLEKYSLPHGAAVKSVVKGAPAALAGIKAGDIITQFNKVEIDEYTDFIAELDKCVPGTKVTAKIYRNGKYYSTTITIGSNNSYN